MTQKDLNISEDEDGTINASLNLGSRSCKGTVREGKLEMEGDEECKPVLKKELVKHFKG